MAKLGVLPTDVYQLTVNEINLFLENRSVHEVELSISSAWRTINFLGALLSDKFKSLDRYLPDTAERKKKKEAKKKELDDKISKIMK